MHLHIQFSFINFEGFPAVGCECKDRKIGGSL